jgi:4-carboxymuconolactone decarboxylase
MISASQTAAFSRALEQFKPESDGQTRLLAYFSVPVAWADDSLMRSAVEVAQTAGVSRAALYEIVLQSYLFLGFPRMLIAAESLEAAWPTRGEARPLEPISDGEAQEWFERGELLCRRVYDSTYEMLRDSVLSKSPEIFRWMIFEGYGKVLSRPGLPVVDRELSIVAFLMAENRPRQLHSHIKGALNVGASEDLVRRVVLELESIVPDGYRAAMEIFDRLGLEAG